MCWGTCCGKLSGQFLVISLYLSSADRLSEPASLFCVLTRLFCKRIRKKRSSFGMRSSICSSFSFASRSNSAFSSASILYSEGSAVRKLYWSDIHQPSKANCVICSWPLSSTLYRRSNPFFTKAMFLHTSPSCRRNCLLPPRLVVKNPSASSFSSLLRWMISSNFLKSVADMKIFTLQK